MKSRRRFNVLDCGRRWGKSLFGQDLATDVLFAGYPVGWFAPTYKLLAEVWREMVDALVPYTVGKNASDHRLELITGGVLEMWTLADPDAGRSRKYARTIVDEAAMVPDLLYIWNSSVRPTLTDYRGDGWFMSTPKGRNDFFSLWQRGQDELQPEWMSWQYTTESNPYIDPAEIQAAKLELPERVFWQEYMAEFLEDSAVFRRIREAATAEPQKQGDPAHAYVVGVDWGKLEDFTVFCVIDTTTHELVHMDRTNRIDYLVQAERLAAVCQRYNPVRVLVEENVGNAAVETLQRSALPVQTFTTTNASKQDLIENLMLAFDRGDLRILDDPILLAELQAFEAQPLMGGRMRYTAPAGMHDDCVMSLALAWELARQPTEHRVVKRRMVA